MNNRIIINADDCGRSKMVDAAIEECIQLGCITSTTVMANMDDFEGAVRLYNTYKDSVSFGCHLNLTQGHPLLKSQILQDTGFTIVSDNGLIKLNGMHLRNSRISKAAKKAIFEELDAQIQKVLDGGIAISHIDSHHHIHNGVSILPIVVKAAKKYNISKIRILRNYLPSSPNLWARKAWRIYLGYLYQGVKTTEWFSSPKEFYRLTKTVQVLKKNTTIELMCHPGGESDSERNEIDLLKSIDFNREFGDTLINYNQL